MTSTDCGLFPSDQAHEIPLRKSVRLHVDDRKDMMKTATNCYRGHFIVETRNEDEDTSLLEASVGSHQQQRNNENGTKDCHVGVRYHIRLAYEFDPHSGAIEENSNITIAPGSIRSTQKTSALLNDLKPVLRQLVQKIVEPHRRSQTSGDDPRNPIESQRVKRASSLGRLENKAKHRTGALRGQKGLQTFDLVDQRACPVRVQSNLHASPDVMWLNQFIVPTRKEDSCQYAVDNGIKAGGISPELMRDRSARVPEVSHTVKSDFMESYVTFDQNASRLNSLSHIPIQQSGDRSWPVLQLNPFHGGSEQSTLVLSGDQPLCEAIAVTTPAMELHPVRKSFSENTFSSEYTVSQKARALDTDTLISLHGAEQGKSRSRYIVRVGMAKSHKALSEQIEQISALAPIKFATDTLGSMELRKTGQQHILRTSRANLCRNTHLSRTTKNRRKVYPENQDSVISMVSVGEQPSGLRFEDEGKLDGNWEFADMSPLILELTSVCSPIGFSEDDPQSEDDLNTNINHANSSGYSCPEEFCGSRRSRSYCLSPYKHTVSLAVRVHRVYDCPASSPNSTKWISYLPYAECDPVLLNPRVRSESRAHDWLLHSLVLTSADWSPMRNLEEDLHSGNNSSAVFEEPGDLHQKRLGMKRILSGLKHKSLNFPMVAAAESDLGSPIPRCASVGRSKTPIRIKGDQQNTLSTKQLYKVRTSKNRIGIKPKVKTGPPAILIPDMYNRPLRPCGLHYKTQIDTSIADSSRLYNVRQSNSAQPCTKRVQSRGRAQRRTPDHPATRSHELSGTNDLERSVAHRKSRKVTFDLPHKTSSHDLQLVEMNTKLENTDNLPWNILVRHVTEVNQQSSRLLYPVIRRARVFRPLLLKYCIEEIPASTGHTPSVFPISAKTSVEEENRHSASGYDTTDIPAYQMHGGVDAKVMDASTGDFDSSSAVGPQLDKVTGSIISRTYSSEIQYASDAVDEGKRLSLEAEKNNSLCSGMGEDKTIMNLFDFAQVVRPRMTEDALMKTDQLSTYCYCDERDQYPTSGRKGCSKHHQVKNYCEEYDAISRTTCGSAYTDHSIGIDSQKLDMSLNDLAESMVDWKSVKIQYPSQLHTQTSKLSGHSSDPTKRSPSIRLRKRPPLVRRYHDTLRFKLAKVARRLAALKPVPLSITIKLDSNNSNDILLEPLVWATSLARMSVASLGTELDMSTFTSSMIDSKPTLLNARRKSNSDPCLPTATDSSQCVRPGVHSTLSQSGIEGSRSEESLIMDEPSCSIRFTGSEESELSSIYLSAPSVDTQIHSAPGELFLWTSAYIAMDPSQQSSHSSTDPECERLATECTNQPDDEPLQLDSNDEYISLTSSRHVDSKTQIIQDNPQLPVESPVKLDPVLDHSALENVHCSSIEVASITQEHSQALQLQRFRVKQVKSERKIVIGHSRFYVPKLIVNKCAIKSPGWLQNCTSQSLGFITTEREHYESSYFELPNAVEETELNDPKFATEALVSFPYAQTEVFTSHPLSTYCDLQCHFTPRVNNGWLTVKKPSTVNIPPLCPIKSTIFLAFRPPKFVIQKFLTVELSDTTSPMSDFYDLCQSNCINCHDSNIAPWPSHFAHPKLRVGIRVQQENRVKLSGLHTPGRRVAETSWTRRRQEYFLRAQSSDLPRVFSSFAHFGQCNNINVPHQKLSPCAVIRRRYRSIDCPIKKVANRSDTPLFHLRALLTRINKARLSNSLPRKNEQLTRKSLITIRQPSRSAHQSQCVNRRILKQSTDERQPIKYQADSKARMGDKTTGVRPQAHRTRKQIYLSSYRATNFSQNNRPVWK